MIALPWKNIAKLRRLLIGCICAGILSGCHGSVVNFFIKKNDSGAETSISDCFIEIISPPGEHPRDFNEKRIILHFRDSKSAPLLTRELRVSANGIKPTVDWKDFPKVRVLLQSDEDVLTYTVNVPY